MEEKRVQELLELVKRNYQEIAAEFDSTRKKEIWPEIREFAGNIKSGDRILDVACGNGRLIETLKDKNVYYLGVDNSSELIKLAKENYSGYEFVVDDMLELKSIPNDSFDNIFCLAALQHIPTKELRIKALKLIAAKLKDNGEIIISNWNLWSKKKYRLLLLKNYWLKIIGKNELGYNDLVFSWKNVEGEEVSERYYHAFTKKELKKLARLAGLKVLTLRRDKYNFWLVLKKG
jgi:ubiquinone/menaquinone biosynthesis C-methylase UbiE